MTDSELAIKGLDGNSICICKNGRCISDTSRGISSIMRFIEQGEELDGSSVADVIVGKAAAMLFVRSGVKNVYGKVMSEAGKGYLEQHGVSLSYGTLTDKIINRDGTDICPMEKTVLSIEDYDEGYLALSAKLKELIAK